MRAQRGGAIDVEIDEVRLLILPGDPEIQERVNRVAPVCELNLQLVHVASVGGRWKVTIEEPASMPETRTFCR